MLLQAFTMCLEIGNSTIILYFIVLRTSTLYLYELIKLRLKLGTVIIIIMVKGKMVICEIVQIDKIDKLVVTNNTIGRDDNK